MLRLSLSYFSRFAGPAAAKEPGRERTRVGALIPYASYPVCVHKTIDKGSILSSKREAMFSQGKLYFKKILTPQNTGSLTKK